MARFLFTIWPFTGHLHPARAMAEELAARGHEIAFYSGAGMRAVAAREGYTYFPLHHIDEKQITYLLEATARMRTGAMGSISQQMEDLKPILTTWQPDVIVCDMLMWAPIFILRELYHIPVASWSIPIASLVFGPDEPPPLLRLPCLLHGNPRRSVAHTVKTMMKPFWTRFNQPLNELRRRYGLPPVCVSVFEYMSQLPLYMVLSSPELDYYRENLPPSVQYVGPVNLSPKNLEPPPAWMNQLHGELPCVYVSEGTQHTGTLLRTAIQALADLPIEVIMTTVKDHDRIGLPPGKPPSNIHVERWISHHHVLPRASLIVMNGGSGLTLAALSDGVPLVVVPTETDKPLNAQRVTAVKAGVRIAPWRCTPHRLRTVVEHVLSDPSFRQHAQCIANSFKRYNGAVQAADLLEGLVRKNLSTDVYTEV